MEEAKNSGLSNNTEDAVYYEAENIGHYLFRFNGVCMVLSVNDRASSAELGLGDQNIGENFDIMEDIARSMPLSNIKSPEWDISVLSRLGFNVTTDTDIWKKVWTIQEHAY